jgi:hypothetical protein
VKSLAVRVLGDFGVDGIEPQAFGSRKARLALQLIALGGGQAVPAGPGRRPGRPAGPGGRPPDQLAVSDPMVQLSSSAARTDSVSHHASSSS